MSKTLSGGLDLLMGQELFISLMGKPEIKGEGLMDIKEGLGQLGISEEDTRNYLAPLIKETIVNELGSIIQDVVRQEIRPTVETLPHLVKNYVDQQLGLVIEEIKEVRSQVNERVDEQVGKAVKANPSRETDDDKGFPLEYKKRLFEKFIDKALGTDEEQMPKIINKIVQQQKLLNESMAAAGIYQPGPEILWRAYQDATGKLYGAMLKSGGFPLPIVDTTKKKSPSLSDHQSESGSNSLRKSEGFDRFLKK